MIQNFHIAEATMIRTSIMIFGILLTVCTFSQTKMYINKSSGETDSLFLSDIKSISFKSTATNPPILGPDMVAVNAGSFIMGSSNILDGTATPVHGVTLGSFNIDIYEVTFDKWKEVRNWALIHGYASTEIAEGRNGSATAGAPLIGTNNPVVYINWYDILKWCNARSEKEGLTPVYYTNNTLATVYRSGELNLAADAVNWTANGYRLPTEAEWEFAARGGTMSNNYTFSGSNSITSVGWYFTNSGSSTHSVGTKTANELGIYDMTGNVQEWCWDWYGSYPSNPQTDPKGPLTGPYRIFRGGNYFRVEYQCRLAYRGLSDFYLVHESDRSLDTGFRCVQD
jgi:formylglycine-generating enzyme required for sulfatase activity